MKSEVKITGNCVEITRVLNAPRQLVFDWWSDGEKLQQWSMCAEATGCEVQMDFRVGGSFTQTMHLPGCGPVSLTGVYDDIVVPERISYRAAMGPAMTHVTIEFFEEGNQTRVVLTHDGLPNEFICKMVSQGTLESFEKFDAVLAGVGGHAAHVTP